MKNKIRFEQRSTREERLFLPCHSTFVVDKSTSIHICMYNRFAFIYLTNLPITVLSIDTIRSEGGGRGMNAKLYKFRARGRQLSSFYFCHSFSLQFFFSRFLRARSSPSPAIVKPIRVPIFIEIFCVKASRERARSNTNARRPSLGVHSADRQLARARFVSGSDSPDEAHIEKV